MKSGNSNIYPFRTGLAWDWLLSLLAVLLGVLGLTIPQLPTLIRWPAMGLLAFGAIYWAWSLLGLQEGRAVYRSMAQRYGIGYSNLLVECTIAPDGSALVRREVSVDAFSVIDRLDTFLVVPESGVGQERHVSPVEMKSLTKGRDLTLSRTYEAGSAVSTMLAISPLLREGDSFTYELVERLPAELYVVDPDNEEVLARRKTPYDYFGWNINRPTKTLSLRVYFPPKVVPDDYGGAVHYAAAAPGLPSQRRQHEEEKRLNGPYLMTLADGRYMLKLDTNYPMIGLIYVLRWQPAMAMQKAK